MMKTVLITAGFTAGTITIVYAVRERNKRLEQEADARNRSLLDSIHEEQEKKEA